MPWASVGDGTDFRLCGYPGQGYRLPFPGMGCFHPSSAVQGLAKLRVDEPPPAGVLAKPMRYATGAVAGLTRYDAAPHGSHATHPA